MILEIADNSYWLLISVLSFVGLAIAVLAVSSGGSGQLCCKRKHCHDDVCCVEDVKKSCSSDPSKAVEGGNLDDDANFLADILIPMRSFSECHVRPYLYEPNHDKSTKETTFAPSYEGKKSIVNTLTEQVQCYFPSKSVEPRGAAEAIYVTLSSSVTGNQSEQEFSTFSGGTYTAFPSKTAEFDDYINVKTYTKLTFSTERSTVTPLATAVSYTPLKNQTTDSYRITHVSNTSGSLQSLAANGGQNAPNYSSSDLHVYNDTLPHSTAPCSDTTQLPGDSITRRPCERRSKVESGHYYSTLDLRDGDRAMSGIYDSIQEVKYHTVCTTSPASTKQQQEVKAKEREELEAAKQKTMTPFGDIELKASMTMNEVY